MPRPYYFEDLPVGAVLEFGDTEVTEREIVEFARRYDPQPFHVDREAGKQSIFGGLCASGWHTCAMMMRMWVDNYLTPEGSLGSPGIDELRWRKPVFPGDRLRCCIEVLEATPSRSRPYMGSVRQRCELRNQHDEVVLSLIGISFFRRRPA
jgi:acyl dehydratase